MKSQVVKNKAFTIVELAVVIVIMGILAGLLLPALASSRTNVKATGCLSNLRLWGSSEQLYAAENSDQIPRDGFDSYGMWPGSYGLTDTNAWFNLLPQYVGEQTFLGYYNSPGANPRLKYPFPGNNVGKIWMCPAATMNQAGYSVLADGGADGFFSYAFNGDLKSGFTYPTMPKLASLQKPSATVLMFDTAFDPLTEIVNASPQYNSVNPANRYKSASIRHNMGAYLAFFDGHVQYFRTAYLTNNPGNTAEPLHPDIIWNPVFRTTNP